MLIILRANHLTSNMRSDVGQYNLITKKMQLWVNSSRLVNGATDLVIPDFNVPEDVKSIDIVDEGTDQTLSVPVSVFHESAKSDGTHVFNFSDWQHKYRRLI